MSECKTCKYMRAIPKIPEHAICKRYPPKPTIYVNQDTGNFSTETMYPILTPAGWCGEYRAALVSVNGVNDDN